MWNSSSKSVELWVFLLASQYEILPPNRNQGISTKIVSAIRNNIICVCPCPMSYHASAVGYQQSESFEVWRACFSSPTKQIYLHIEYFVRLGFLGGYWGFFLLVLGLFAVFCLGFFPLHTPSLPQPCCSSCCLSKELYPCHWAEPTLILPPGHKCSFTKASWDRN